MSTGSGGSRGAAGLAAPAWGRDPGPPAQGLWWSWGWALTGPRWVRREEPWGSGVTLLRDLRFSSLSAQHLRTNYTCVVLSPLGMDTKAVRWVPPAPVPSSAASGGLG